MNDPKLQLPTITGWQLQFFRSAKNSGFEVRQPAIEDAVTYIRRCFNPNRGALQYYTHASGRPKEFSLAMAGAGILALAHAGAHNSQEAVQSAEWILKHPFTVYNAPAAGGRDRFHYGVFHCCHAMYQLGGKYWQDFFPRTAMLLVRNQKSDGSWHPEFEHHEKQYGRTYTTSLAVLALSTPNEILPIYQR